MYRFSNTVIGFLNLFTLLASIPIIGGGLWMARSTTTCESFLQKPLLLIGFIILIISLAGFIGACFHVAWALWVYLAVMLFLIGGLMALTVFGFVVTGKGGGVDVPGRVFKKNMYLIYTLFILAKFFLKKRPFLRNFFFLKNVLCKERVFRVVIAADYLLQMCVNLVGTCTVALKLLIFSSYFLDVFFA
ncbi:hypothetical protein CsSME_00000604 [Camellia sinensis var. sinensis]